MTVRAPKPVAFGLVAEDIRPIDARRTSSSAREIGPDLAFRCIESLRMLADIAKAEIFRVLPPQRRARLELLVHQTRLEPRRVLYFEGAAAERLWIVRDGRVRLYKSSASAQITTLDVLGPGEVFGALTTLDRDTYPSSAEAIDEGHVWWLPRPAFLRVLESEPAVALEILQIVSRRLRQAEERLRAFAQDPAPARLAAALLRAASGEEASVTRRALAESAGTTVETAIRVLRRFERAGLVRGEVGKIDILQRAALEDVAARGSE
jgi:CRP/FNR family transcriptional regulator